jgi:hypothetical protein
VKHTRRLDTKRTKIHVDKRARGRQKKRQKIKSTDEKEADIQDMSAKEVAIVE